VKIVERKQRQAFRPTSRGLVFTARGPFSVSDLSFNDITFFFQPPPLQFHLISQPSQHFLNTFLGARKFTDSECLPKLPNTFLCPLPTPPFPSTSPSTRPSRCASAAPLCARLLAPARSESTHCRHYPHGGCRHKAYPESTRSRPSEMNQSIARQSRPQSNRRPYESRSKRRMRRTNWNSQRDFWYFPITDYARQCLAPNRASPARPAPSEPRQGRKAAAVGGRSGALRVACPFSFAFFADCPICRERPVPPRVYPSELRGGSLSRLCRVLRRTCGPLP